MARTPAKTASPPPEAAPTVIAQAKIHSDGIARNSLVILAVIASGGALYWLGDILTPLALALFLAIMVDSFARRLTQQWPRLPDAIAFLAAIILSIGIFVVSALVVADNAASFAAELASYGPRLDGLIARLSGLAGMETPPSIAEVIRKLEPAKYLGQFAQGLRGVGSDLLFVLIYLGFIIAARRGFKRKIVALFPHNRERTEAVAIFDRIRFGVERYLWVQTITGLMIGAASWVAMTAFGLENALFWAFLIFLASYIPVIGGIIGVAAPTVFALVQFDTPELGIALLVILQLIQFLFGNIVTTRLQGDSLNIDPVVVLLSLALWGALWGLPGMFLSTPLAVMAMIILAEFDGSRWIAVLMSENGDPQGLDAEGRRRRRGKLFGKADRAT